MNRPLTLAWLILAALIAAAPTVLGQADKKPVAVIVEPVKDFETTPKGKVIDHVFEVRNEGQGTLQITEVTPACGCTVVEYDKTAAPGQTAKIRASIETRDFTGPIAKTISVFTNDPANPKLELVIKADVKPFLSVSPGYARFNYVQGENVGALRQVIWAPDNRDFKVLDVKSPYDYVSVKLREATAEERNAGSTGRQWVIEVAIDPKAPVGALRDFVEATTDHPQQKVLKIPVSGFVRPRQFVTPEKVDFGQLETSALPVSTTLALTSFITKDIEVTKIETGLPGLTAEVENMTNQPGHRFQVHLKLGPTMPKGAFEGVVKVHVSDTLNPVVEVPVKGTIL